MPAGNMVDELACAVFATALGWIGVAVSAQGVRGVTLPQPNEDAAQSRLMADWPDVRPAYTHEVADIATQIREYAQSRRVDFRVQLDLAQHTAFRRQVWETTLRIPYGETRSYAWVAEQIGKPGAARAVGQALGANPVPLIVPCHRVVGNDGGLCGFGGGLDMKERLLALERAGAVAAFE